MDELYSNIKKFRQERNLKQSDLAELMGYTSGPMITKVEKGEVDLSYSRICKFAEILGVSVPELTGYAGSDFIRRINNLPKEGIDYMLDQLDYAEFKFNKNTDNEPKKITIFDNGIAS